MVIGIIVKLSVLLSPMFKFPIFQLFPVKFKSVLVGLMKPIGIAMSTLTFVALINPIFSTVTANVRLSPV